MSITRVQRANAARHLHLKHRLVSLFIFRGVLSVFIIDYNLNKFIFTVIRVVHKTNVVLGSVPLAR